MSLLPQSPRVGRSPRLKAKWLSNTMAYQYGNNGAKKSEIIVLTNDLDQYLQDMFQSIDTKGRGKISAEEFYLLCDVLNLKDTDGGLKQVSDLSFKDFHDRLCEHFACYGDYIGFLVNQTFRAKNNNNNNPIGKETNSTIPDCTRRSSFQKQMATSKSHQCIHDAELFKNWDKLRLAGFRLSEMREHIDHLLYEVTFHKEESQTLREIIEDLRTMLQASDAQNIGMQVALKRHQRGGAVESSLTVGLTPPRLGSTNNRHSLPPDTGHLVYQPLKGEERSVTALARELSHVRELRDREVRELISFNNQLQHDVTDLSREICRLEAEKKRQAGQLDLIVKTYTCCRELFAVCVDSLREVESSDATSGLPSPSPLRTPSRQRTFSFSGARDKSSSDSHQTPATSTDKAGAPLCDIAADDSSPPEVVLIRRLEHEIAAQLEELNSQHQEAFRVEQELSLCRRHLQTANFQVEALETECGRLLALEDQLVSVFRFLQKGRSQCLSRKTLGQLLLDVIDSSFGGEDQDMTADQFIRILQKTLSDCPLFLLAT
ncbi:EF-hand and coiled-coil domain-containing protein 1-like [Mya arenaria]|uniref:EF-hand and coiled-coil domain-containing protein 1-like n=1 Tax=Mya arenaria TaxID=6604 RepID=UPI0022E7903E|nr:EF-hand and coiled-coil domain-containing protein 1-like [Mya arenaria]